MLPAALLQLPEIGPEGIRWPVVVSALALLIVLVGFRVRSDLAEAMGLTGPEIALLTLGSIAAPVLNVPLAVLGDSVLAVNLGGAIVPVLVTLRLHQRGHAPWGQLAALGVAVAAATRLVVRVDPQAGVLAPFPAFLLPATVALVGALLLTRGRPTEAGPLAFAAGTLGALVGADLLTLPSLLEVARSAEAGTALVLGGGGAFDLIFLSGALGLALSLFLALFLTPDPGIPLLDAKAPPRRVPEPERLLRQLERLDGLSPRERSLAYLARANRALERPAPTQAVKHAHRAVDALLRSGSPRVIERVASEGPQRIKDQMQELTERRRELGGSGPPWHEAADAVELAKHLTGALWRASAGRVRVGGDRR